MAIDLDFGVSRQRDDTDPDTESGGAPAPTSPDRGGSPVQSSGGVWPLGDIALRTDGVGELARAAGKAFDDLGQITSEFSCGAARSSVAASTISEHVDELSAALAQVSAAVESLRDAAGETTASAGESASAAAELAACGADGLRVVGPLIDAVALIHTHSEEVHDRIEALSTRELAEIESFSTVINRIASNTKLLALNAAIEAARAGEHGRGFSVVAEEVGRLASETSAQTGRISETIERVRTEMNATVAAAASAREASAQSADDAAAGRTALERIGELAEHVDARVTHIASLAELQQGDVQAVQGNLETITLRAREIEDQARAAAAQQLELSASTERAYAVVGRFDTGGALTRLRGRAERLADDLRVVLEHAVDAHRVSLRGLLELRYEEARGASIQRFARLFDVSHASPDGFEPAKFHTAYDALVDEAMMEHMDAVLEEEPGLTFALPFDLNTFAPAHNRTFSRAITGDPATDLAGNRTKRFFLEAPALVRASRMELGASLPDSVLTRGQIQAAGARLSEPTTGTRPPFLLLTYARDTGAVLSTLSVPLYVHGQRFGCVCLGWDPERLR
ncbi:MAG TPA: methyl-accepting chemotaxis protein [Solirubrobacteraceae bacterium]|jgi:methyl-accepting chemotaxis protein